MKLDSPVFHQQAATYRPVIMGTKHVMVAGHYTAAHVGLSILEAGGNAIDAGVAAGIAVGVLPRMLHKQSALKRLTSCGI